MNIGQMLGQDPQQSPAPTAQPPLTAPAQAPQPEPQAAPAEQEWKRGLSDDELRARSAKLTEAMQLAMTGGPQMMREAQEAVKIARQSAMNDYASGWQGDPRLPKDALDYAKYMAHGAAIIGMPATPEEVKQISEWAERIDKEGYLEGLSRLHQGDFKGAVDVFNRHGTERIDPSTLKIEPAVAQLGPAAVNTHKVSFTVDGKQEEFLAFDRLFTAMAVKEQVEMLNKGAESAALVEQRKASAASSYATARYNNERHRGGPSGSSSGGAGEDGPGLPAMSATEKNYIQGLENALERILPKDTFEEISEDRAEKIAALEERIMAFYNDIESRAAGQAPAAGQAGDQGGRVGVGGGIGAALAGERLGSGSEPLPEEAQAPAPIADGPAAPEVVAAAPRINQVEPADITPEDLSRYEKLSAPEDSTARRSAREGAAETRSTLGAFLGDTGEAIAGAAERANDVRKSREVARQQNAPLNRAARELGPRVAGVAEGLAGKDASPAFRAISNEINGLPAGIPPDRKAVAVAAMMRSPAAKGMLAEERIKLRKQAKQIVDEAVEYLRSQGAPDEAIEDFLKQSGVK